MKNIDIFIQKHINKLLLVIILMTMSLFFIAKVIPKEQINPNHKEHIDKCEIKPISSFSILVDNINNAWCKK